MRALMFFESTYFIHSSNKIQRGCSLKETNNKARPESKLEPQSCSQAHIVLKEALLCVIAEVSRVRDICDG